MLGEGRSRRGWEQVVLRDREEIGERNEGERNEGGEGGSM